MRLSLRDRSWLAPAGLAAIAFASLPALVMGQEAGKQVKPTTADKPYDFTWGWKVVDQPVEIDHRQKNLVNPWWVFPDGMISTFKLTNGNYCAFWSEAENYRTEGPTPLLEDQFWNNPPTPYPEIYYGGRVDKPVFYNGGRWLLSVHRHPTNGNPKHLVAFVHAEDGYWPRHVAGGPAWKSIMVSHSLDEGITWQDKGQIITSLKPRPSDKDSWNATMIRYTSGGVGNHAVIWDHTRNQWTMIFEEHWNGVAISKDPDGLPGSWYKYNSAKKGFTEPGLGGAWTKIDVMLNYTGTNPAITYNTYLKKFIVAYGLWMSKGANMGITATTDFINFEPVRLFFLSVDGSRAWYPTIISNETGSFESGQRIHVYYADKFKVPVNDSRQLTKRTFDLCLGPKCGDNSSYILSPATEGRGNTTTNIVNDISAAPRTVLEPMVWALQFLAIFASFAIFA